MKKCYLGILAVLIAFIGQAQKELIVSLNVTKNGENALISLTPKQKLVQLLGGDKSVKQAFNQELIQRLEQRATTEAGKKAFEHLKETYSVFLSNENEVNYWMDELKRADFVRNVALKTTVPPPPPADIPPATPTFEADQTFLFDNPGLNVKTLWNRGIWGDGIVLNDVEYGLNSKHEDIAGLKIKRVSPYGIPKELTYAYYEHGTAALGISAAGDNGYGTKGMAFNLKKAQLFPEWTSNGIDRVDAILRAIDSTERGHVMLLEMQTYGNTDFCPAEFEQAVWDATKAASELGIIVVAAAGNGNEDLDSDFYTTYRARGNSGAIIVGAGTSTTTHAKKGFSTFGKRLDIQAWGENVVSPGYGSFRKIGTNDTNQFYGKFSGTSSASALIAGCAVLLQSHFNKSTGDYLTRDQLLTALKTGAYKQSDSATAGNIGRHPNLANAVVQVDKYIAEWFKANGMNDFSSLAKQFEIYPNPSDGLLHVVSFNNMDIQLVELVDVSGKVVKKTQNTQAIDATELQDGIYHVLIHQDGQVIQKKWLKSGAN